jgi:hypothetical protein
VEGYEMIVFVLTYAVLALLGLSVVGSVSAEIREPSARATRSIAELDFLELVPPGRILGFMEQEKK